MKHILSVYEYWHFVEILRSWRVAGSDDPRKYHISTNHMFGGPWKRKKRERERERRGPTSLVDHVLNGLPKIDFL